MPSKLVFRDFMGSITHGHDVKLTGVLISTHQRQIREGPWVTLGPWSDHINIRSQT